MTRTPPARIGKIVPLKNATDPVSFPTGGKPAVPPELKIAPRADGSMADGETGGNFQKLTGALAAPNPGPTATQDVADQTSEEFAK
jgi:hypothetical protein